MKNFKLYLLVIFWSVFIIPFDLYGLDISFLNQNKNVFNYAQDYQFLEINLVSMGLKPDQCSYNKKFLQAMGQYQNGEYSEAEFEFRKLSIKYPLCADSRAALTALLWRKGFFGEAESNWHAVLGLDNRYDNEEWLLDIPNWHSKPMKDLSNFFVSMHK